MVIGYDGEPLPLFLTCQFTGRVGFEELDRLLGS